MNINSQIDHLSASLLRHFHEIASEDIECAALILDLTYLLKKLKTPHISELDANLVVNNLGKVLTHIILKESK